LATPFSFAANLSGQNDSTPKTMSSSDTNQTQEINTATTHAQAAADSANKKTADSHLQNVVNCLEGKDGQSYDASAGDDCSTMGNGALNDAQDSNTKTKLGKALAEAKKGLKANELAATKRDARKVVETLKSISSNASVTSRI
jgi:hypothetical protein